MNTLLGGSVRSRVFLSYHHSGDQLFYNEFSRIFHDNYEAITDTSLERKIESADHNYIMRRIREEYLHGSSCTIVLCGKETPYRKYVDWEIDASLHQQMALIGIRLPTIIWQGEGTTKPPRLQDNIDSRYACWVGWTDLVSNPGLLSNTIAIAKQRSKDLIRNSRESRSRNG